MQTTPDLFSTDTVRDASPLPPKQSTTAIVAPSSQRHILPKNLDHAVKQLSDGELDELFAVAFGEAKRRGRLPRGIGTDPTPSSRALPDLPRKGSSAEKTTHQRKVKIAEASLTRGQMNAVRAAFKAGITPSRIARQFGISQSNVRNALANDPSK